MPKPIHTYRRLKTQDTTRAVAGNHKVKQALQSAEAWKSLEKALRKSRLDERRLKAIRALMDELSKGRPISREGKRRRLYIEALEQVHELAQQHKELSQLDSRIEKQTQAIIRVPRSQIKRSDPLHAPSLITACLALVILVEGLLAGRRRQG